jgi:hypothetical protein
MTIENYRIIYAGLLTAELNLKGAAVDQLHSERWRGWAAEDLRKVQAAQEALASVSITMAEAA